MVANAAASPNIRDSVNYYTIAHLPSRQYFHLLPAQPLCGKHCTISFLIDHDYYFIALQEHKAVLSVLRLFSE
jgi:hypothetical protein